MAQFLQYFDYVLMQKVLIGCFFQQPISIGIYLTKNLLIAQTIAYNKTKKNVFVKWNMIKELNDTKQELDNCTYEKAECKNNYSYCNQTNIDLLNKNKNLTDDLQICKNDLQICKDNDTCQKKLVQAEEKLVKSEADSKYYNSLLILFIIMFILSLVIFITIITCLVQPTKEKWLAFYTYIKSSCKPDEVKTLEKITSEPTKSELTSKKQRNSTHKIFKKTQVTPL